MSTVRLLMVSQHALGKGAGLHPSMHWAGGWGCIPACTGQGDGSVFPGGAVPARGCTWWGCVSQHAMGQTPPCGQTDTCENITFANFVYGR